MPKPLREVVEEQRIKIENQAEAIGKLYKDLKLTEESLAWWQKKVISQKKMKQTLLSLLVLVPLVLQLVFIEPLDVGWETTVSQSVVYYVIIGVVLSVCIPLIVFAFLFIKIWDEK